MDDAGPFDKVGAGQSDKCIPSWYIYWIIIVSISL